ncbi:MAG TPA: hypothetical protein VEY95_10620 [Azospirillaceae bacterium]|nr:hypothetical protein [Azospirillaceae bacterium]
MSETDRKPDRSMVFAFAHKVFELRNGHFIRSPTDDEPVFRFKLDEQDVSVSVKSLSSTFDIPEDSLDGILLDTVVKGLKYVKTIRPGDSIPREILDGSASWAVDDQHMELARGRLTMQLVSWFSGGETVITDLDHLAQIADDPGTKRRVQDAFQMAADKLALDGSEEGAPERIERLARELSYVEALRDRMRLVVNIRKGLERSAALYRTDRSVMEEMTRMLTLIGRPIADLEQRFEQLDAQTGEILSMLRAMEPTIGYIRGMRDDLHQILMVWDEMIEKWKDPPRIRNEGHLALLRSTYQFLARRFTHATDWRLAQRKPPSARNRAEL